MEQWAGRFVAQLATSSAVLTTFQFRDQPARHGHRLTGQDRGQRPYLDCPPTRTARLWDQVEKALRTWQAAGAPDLPEFEMTPTPYEHTILPVVAVHARNLEAGE